MIDVQVCSCRQNGLLKLAESMISSGLVNLGATLSVSYDINTIDTSKFDGFDFIRFIPQPLFAGVPPMYLLRSTIHKLPNLGVPWLFYDDDDTFTKESTDYLISCVSFMNTFEKEVDRPVFLGTVGHFGSNHHADMIHISPRNALMAKGKGLLFSPNINFGSANFEQHDHLVGGLEDIFMSALAIRYFDAIPLKRFQSPAKATMRKTADRQASPIHNYVIWSENIIPTIRDLSGDQKWTFPIDMNSKGSITPKAWVKRSEAMRLEYGL